MSRNCIAIDIGGTKTLFGLISAEGEILARQSIPSNYLENRQSVAVLTSGINTLLKVTGEKITGIGIGVPGILDENGFIVGTPNTPGLEGINLSRMLAEELGIPTFTDNDVNLAALGESWVGSGVGMEDILFIAVGTGIGGGIIINGSVYKGTGGAGEIGHCCVDPNGYECYCGNNGCLEAIASGRAIELQYSKLSGEELPAYKVFERAVQGDKLAMEIVEKSIYSLGLAIGNFINIFSPQAVVLGGGITSGQGSSYIRRISEVAKKQARGFLWEKTRLLMSSLGNDAGILGGAKMCLDMVEA